MDPATTNFEGETESPAIINEVQDQSDVPESAPPTTPITEAEGIAVDTVLHKKQEDLAVKLAATEDLPVEERDVARVAIESDHYYTATSQWLQKEQGQSVRVEDVVGKLSMLQAPDQQDNFLVKALGREGLQSEAQLQELKMEILTAASEVTHPLAMAILRKKESPDLKDVIQQLNISPDAANDYVSLQQALAEKVDFRIVLRRMIQRREIQKAAAAKTAGLEGGEEPISQVATGPEADQGGSDQEITPESTRDNLKDLFEFRDLIDDSVTAVDFGALIGMVFTPDKAGYSSYYGRSRGGSTLESSDARTKEKDLVSLFKEMFADKKKRQDFFKGILPDAGSRDWKDVLKEEFESFDVDGLVSGKAKYAEFLKLTLKTLRNIESAKFASLTPENIVLGPDMQVFLLEQAQLAFKDSQTIE